MSALAGGMGIGYSCSVLTTVGTGVDSPIAIGAAAPPCDTGAFFAPAVFNGGRCWEAEKPAGSYARSVNPTPTRLLLFDSSVDGLQSHRSSAMNTQSRVDRPRSIDPNRLYLPIDLLIHVLDTLPRCISQIESEADYREMEQCIELLTLTLAELRRIQASSAP